MTNDDLIEMGNKLLVLAGMRMEDLSPELIGRVDDAADLRDLSDRLTVAAQDFAALAATARSLARLAEEAPE